MSHPAQSTAPSTSSQELAQQTGPSTDPSVSSKRRRDTSPNGNGSGGQKQSAAIHQGTSRLMALMQQEQAALASMYQERINSLSRKVKATQEQVDYLTQVAGSGSDLLSTQNEFQKKLDDAQKIIQQQKKANAKILDAIRRNGMELVSTSEGSGQKVDLRFNNHTQEVISKFFHLPDANTPVPSDPSLAQLATSKHNDLTPQHFFALLQNAIGKSQSAEGDVSSTTEKASDPAPDDVVIHSPTNDIPPESTTA